MFLRSYWTVQGRGALDHVYHVPWKEGCKLQTPRRKSGVDDLEKATRRCRLIAVSAFWISGEARLLVLPD